jgi:hypothetical protein
LHKHENLTLVSYRGDANETVPCSPERLIYDCGYNHGEEKNDPEKKKKNTHTMKKIVSYENT